MLLLFSEEEKMSLDVDQNLIFRFVKYIRWLEFIIKLLRIY